MAKPIVEISRRPLRGGLVEFHVLFLYPLDSLVSVGTEGASIKLKKRSDLPPGVETYQLISSEELEAIDTGVLFFQEDRIEQAATDTLADVLLKVRKRYDKGWIWLGRLRESHENAGKRYDSLAAVRR